MKYNIKIKRTTDESIVVTKKNITYRQAASIVKKHRGKRYSVEVNVWNRTPKFQRPGILELEQMLNEGI